MEHGQDIPAHNAVLGLVKIGISAISAILSFTLAEFSQISSIIAAWIAVGSGIFAMRYYYLETKRKQKLVHRKPLEKVNRN